MKVLVVGWKRKREEVKWVTPSQGDNGEEMLSSLLGAVQLLVVFRMGGSGKR